MKAGPGVCGMTRSLTRWRWAQPSKSRRRDNTDFRLADLSQPQYDSFNHASTKTTLLAMVFFLWLHRSYFHDAPQSIDPPGLTGPSGTWTATLRLDTCLSATVSAMSIAMEETEEQAKASGARYFWVGDEQCRVSAATLTRLPLHW